MRLCLLWLVGLWAPMAGAGPKVVLQATVSDDLRTIRGELRTSGFDGLQLVDALGQLPLPQDDQLVRRTFPGAIERGWVHIDAFGPDPDRAAFHTVLPRRYGAAGLVPGRGLFANGLWHPQPVGDGALPVIEWEVQLQIPPGAVGVLNDHVGSDLLRWSGRAERLALAVVPNGRVSRVDLDQGELVWVDRGPVRARRDGLVAALANQAWPAARPERLVVVETPSRRRLARTGPGVVFLSDRALRVSGSLATFHMPAVQGALMSAGLPLEDPWERQFVATATVDAAGPPPDLRSLLGWFSWIPQVDTLLYDGRLPFYSEVMAETWPGDRVQDDLVEVLTTDAPAQVVARWVDAWHGPGTAQQVGTALLGGFGLGQALEAAGVPAGQLQAWRAQAGAPVDLALRVEQSEAGTEVMVSRTVEGTAPEAPVVVQVDDERSLWKTPSGTGAHRRTLTQRPRQVRVDPDGLLPQSDRSDERWPRRWTAVVSAFPYELVANNGRVSAAADVVLRRQYDTRWLYAVGLDTGPTDLVRASVGVYRFFGPLQDRRRRPFRLWLSGGPALLDPGYREVVNGSLAVGTSLGGAWDTRVDDIFPRRGHRLSVGLGGGWIPGTTARWGSASALAKGLLPLGGRLVLASKLRAGLAEGDVDHRLLDLGGSNGVQGLPAGQAVGHTLAGASTELRWMVVRNASVPGPLLWLSHIQVSAGADGGVLLRRGETEAGDTEALGATAGLGFTGDVLGARPTLLGVWAATPLWAAGTHLTDPWVVYVRATQAY